MKPNRHAKFICHMAVLFVAMMVISIAIEMRYYAQIVIWGLFAYIMAKDFIDYSRCDRVRRKCEQDKAKIAEVMGKLDKIKKQLEGTV